MKYLIVLLVVGTAIWLWRSNRHEERSHTAAPPKKPQPKGAATVIVACQHCGLHLPKADAIQGAQGYYCDTEHRRHHEG